MARIKMTCSWLQELAYSTRVRLKAVPDENATAESELAHVGSLTMDILNPNPPITFERGKTYFVDITSVEA